MNAKGRRKKRREIERELKVVIKEKMVTRVPDEYFRLLEKLRQFAVRGRT